MSDPKSEVHAAGPRRSRWTRSRLLLALVAAQIVFLLGLAGSYYATGRWGEEIRLQTKPVDPRDLLYGDYVVLSYEISDMDAGLWRGGSQLPEKGEVVYVALRTDSSGISRPVAVYGEKPAAADGETILKGRATYSWDRSIRIEYGLERYYVPEDTGKALEQEARDTTVLVRIAPWGQPRLMGFAQTP